MKDSIEHDEPPGYTYLMVLLEIADAFHLQPAVLTDGRNIQYSDQGPREYRDLVLYLSKCHSEVQSCLYNPLRREALHPNQVVNLVMHYYRPWGLA